MSILFVFTSADTNLLGGKTGWFVSEGAHPYKILAPHYKIDFASPAGSNPPVDERSVQMFAEDQDSIDFLNNETVKSKLANAKKLSEVQAKDYDAIFYVGGGGPVIDLAHDPVNHKLASEFWQSGKIVSAICHGTAAAVGAVDAEGKSIFLGRSFTGFSNAEEHAIDNVKAIPFLLEDKITGLGGKYEKSPALWEPHAVVDGKLVTGQNQNSGVVFGNALLKALKESQ